MLYPAVIAYLVHLTIAGICTCLGAACRAKAYRLDVHCAICIEQGM